MKKYYCLLLIVFFVCLSCFSKADNRRHFIILQDNSGSYYSFSRQDIEALQNEVVALFDNQYNGDGFDLLSKECSQGIQFFDSNNDEISFLWFVADQAGNVNFYNNTDGEYQYFEEYFFTYGKNPSFKGLAKGSKEFLEENFSNRPALNSTSNYGGFLSVYSFTSLAYPLCLDILNTDYCQEYVILIVSDFKSGSTFGNKRDESIFRDAFRLKADSVLSRVAFLNGQFVTADLCNHYIGKGAEIIGYYAYKIKPNVGYPKPEIIEVRINSNIVFDQVSYEEGVYSLRESEIVFQHSDDFSIREIGMEISLPSGDKCYKDITTETHEKDGCIKINSIRGIVLPNVINDSSEFPSEIRFVIKGNYDLGGVNNSSIKYVFDSTRSLGKSNFNLKTKLSTTQMTSIICMTLLLIGALLALVFVRKGKPQGIKIKFNHFNDSYETIDFSPEGSGKVHTDYKYWSEQDEENGFEITIQGRFDYLNLNKWYNWKQKSGNPVRVRPRIKPVDGFSIFVTDGSKISTTEDQPIEIDAFKDGKFSFVFRFKRMFSEKAITEPIKFEIGAVLESTFKGMIRHFELERTMKYEFHIGPDLGNVWLGVDPGTTGSCVAVATTVNDLTIEQDSNGKDKIIPSVIAINPDGLERDSIRKNMVFGSKADALQSEDIISKNKFLSIKKLLGYNDKFKLLGKKDGKRYSVEVDSSLLSTLLIEGLLNQQKVYIESDRTRFDGFFGNDGEYAPKRAVFAIPNNFTAAKMQQLHDCIFGVENLTIKEVRFIYEAEAIIVNYINNGSKSNVEQQKKAEGETIFIFDMGGATINATLANVKYRQGQEGKDWVYDINIICKLGYGIGGDTIDYAYLKWIFSKSDSYPILKEKDPFGSDKDMMAERRKLKNEVLTKLKINTINNYKQDKKGTQLIDRMDIKNFNGYGLSLLGEDEGGDPFIKDIKNDKSSFLYGPIFREYVWDNIRAIINDVLTKCSKESESPININTVIMSGRSSHFPRVSEIVEQSIKKKVEHYNFILLDLEESKSAVARGACYYGVMNNRIRLNNMTTNGAFGVIQTVSLNQPSSFIKLIGDGEEFQNGVVTGESSIDECQGFELDGRRVRFCQVMGVDPDKIIAKAEKHKYTELASLRADTFRIKSVHISVSDKDKIQCSVTDVQGTPQPPVEAVVCDSDITACNDEQYTFFVKQS